MRFLLILALLSPITALATTFIAQDFSVTVSAAPVIVRGTVGSSYADWGKSGDGSKRIYTFYDLQISEVVKGDVSGVSLVFREMGGTKEGVGMDVPGSAHFDRGEDVVLMLGDKNTDGSYDIRSLMMGKLNVQHADDGADVLSGPALAYQQPGEMVHGDGDEPSKPAAPQKRWTMAGLKELVASQRKSPMTTATGVVPTPAKTQAPTLQPSPHEGSADSSADRSDSQSQQQQPASSGTWKWILVIVALGLGAVISMGARKKH